MATIIKCPECGRPNGPRFPKCMYCSADLPEVEEDATESAATKESRLGQALDSSFMASLPPGLRAQFKPMTARKKEAPKLRKESFSNEIASPMSEDLKEANAQPKEPSAPTDERDPEEVPLTPPALKSVGDLAIPNDLESVDGLVPMDDSVVSYDQTLDGVNVEPLVASVVDEDDPIDVVEPISLEVLDVEPLPITDGLPQTPTWLQRGRGPWGPRDAEARVILVPEPIYNQRLPWLRARLNQTLGLDAYTCNMYLQRDFPVFLKDCPTRVEAQQLAGNLVEGGLNVIIVTRVLVERQPVPIEMARAEIETDRVRFVVAQEGEPWLEIPRRAFQAAHIGEIKPPESAKGPLMERTFWRNKPRASRTFDEIQNPYWLLDLITDDLIVRVRSDHFDFSCLGEMRAPSSLLNLRTLPAAMSPPGVDLPLDDLFKRVPRLKRELNPDADGTPEIPADEILFDEYVMLQTFARRDGTPPKES